MARTRVSNVGISSRSTHPGILSAVLDMSQEKAESSLFKTKPVSSGSVAQDEVAAGSNSDREALAVHRLASALPADPDPGFGLRQRPTAVALHGSLLRVDRAVEPGLGGVCHLPGLRPELVGAFGAEGRVPPHGGLPAQLARQIQFRTPRQGLGCGGIYASLSSVDRRLNDPPKALLETHRVPGNRGRAVFMLHDEVQDMVLELEDVVLSAGYTAVSQRTMAMPQLQVGDRDERRREELQTSYCPKKQGAG